MSLPDPSRPVHQWIRVEDAINFDPTELVMTHANYVWSTSTLAWVKMTQPGGGAGGAVTLEDGADAAQGSTADAAWVSGAGTVISLLKKIASAAGAAVSVSDGADVAEGATTDAAVIGDAAGTVSAKLRGLNTQLASVINAGAVTSNVSNSTGVGVTGTFWQTTQPVSLDVGQQTMANSHPVTLASDTVLPLPTGAALEAGGNLDSIEAYLTQERSSQLDRILIELQVISQILAIGLNVKDEPADLRAAGAWR